MKQVYLESYGCQMNFSDSEIVASILDKNGYKTTRDLGESDLILLNTCSIREKAEQKIYSLARNLKPLKEANPDLILGFTGCLAQQEGERFLEKLPFVDLVIGPDGVEHIVRVVDEVKNKKVSVVRTQFDTDISYKIPELSGETPLNPGSTTFVNIIKGCDKFCTFCVVPFTRGRERSR